MKTLLRLGLIMLLAICMPALMAQELPAQPIWQVPDEGFVWKPLLSPEGPMVIVVSLKEQRARVYRNGVLIGVSKVSTGKAGHETPTGVFTILEKHREHYSNRYDNAPMPFMQRLTWDGVALHAGNVPSYPASHGCIRLPYLFSEALFGVTTRGMTVVVSDQATPPTVVYPGLFTREPAATVVRSEAEETFLWIPERSPDGPVTLVLSSRDREIIVLRNAVEIGRSPVEMSDDLIKGTRVYSLLHGSSSQPSAVVPGRPALRWLALSLESEAGTSPPDLREWTASGRLRIDPIFASLVYDVLVPGTSLIVTDEAIEPDRPTAAVAPILQAEQGDIERDKLPGR
nr:L,D-transpeptidase [Lysobacter capsici]